MIVLASCGAQMDGFEVYWYNPTGADQQVIPAVANGLSVFDAFAHLDCRPPPPAALEPEEVDEEGFADAIEHHSEDSHTVHLAARQLVAPTAVTICVALGEPPQHPRAVFAGEIIGLDLKLSQQQYEEMVQLGQRFSRLNEVAAQQSALPTHGLRFLEYRPVDLLPIRRGKSSREWWRYAARAVRDRRLYTMLYKRHQAAARETSNLNTHELALLPEEASEVLALERRLCTNILMACRDVADAELDLESTKKSAQSSWTFFGLLGSAEGSEDFELSEAERAELMDTIGNAAITVSGNMPDDYVSVQFQLQLREGSMTLRLGGRNIPGKADDGRDVVRASFGVLYELSKCPVDGSLLLDVAIQSITIEDCQPENDHYRFLVCSRTPPREINVSEDSALLMEPAVESSDMKCMESVGEDAFDWMPTRQRYNEHAFHFHLILKPRQKRYEIGMFSATPVTAVHNPRVFRDLYRIFETPMPSEWKQEAALKFADMTTATENQILDVMNANRICVQAVLKTPIIVIPTDCSSDSTPVLIMDFGVLAIDADHGCARTCAALAALESESRSPASQDFVSLDGMHKKFPEYISLSMTGTQAILSPTAVPDWAEIADGESDSVDAARLVKKCSIELAISGRPAKPSTPTEIVFGMKVGAVSVVVSPAQLRQLAAVVRTVAATKPSTTQTLPGPTTVDASAASDGAWISEQMYSSLTEGFFKCPSLELTIANDDGVRVLAVNMRELRSHMTSAPQRRAEFLLQRFDVVYEPENLFLARSVLDTDTTTSSSDLVTVRYGKIDGGFKAQIFFAQFEVHWHPDIISEVFDLVQDFVAARKQLSSFDSWYTNDQPKDDSKSELHTFSKSPLANGLSSDGPTDFRLRVICPSLVFVLANQDRTKLLRCKVLGVHHEFLKKSADDSMLIAFAVQNLYIEDCITTCRPYRFLLSSHHLRKQILSQSDSSYDPELHFNRPKSKNSQPVDAGAEDMVDWTDTQERYKEFAFHFHVDVQPLLKRCNIGMFSATPLNIIYNPDVLQKCVRILGLPAISASAPTTRIPAFGTAIDAASAAAESVGADMRHTNRICVQAVLKTPIIVIPTDCSSDSTPVL
eukprot:SAG31_NODE_4271_length_3389_cov_2.799392_1_plen_1096_part_10